jgi:hypothetical protein
MVAVSQSKGGGIQSGTEIEEEIRSLESRVIHPAKTLNTLADIRRKTGQQEPAEPVMGIACGHRNHLGKKLLLLFYTMEAKKGILF